MKPEIKLGGSKIEIHLIKQQKKGVLLSRIMTRSL